MLKKWTLPNCKQDALQYKTRTEWVLNSASAYVAASRNRWLEECCPHMPTKKGPNKRFYTIEKCMEIALKFNTRIDWKKGDVPSYKEASRMGWLGRCTTHMRKLKGAWNTVEKCKVIALNYKTKSEWRKSHPSSYTYASRKRWIKECCAHMDSYGGSSNMENELALTILKDYKILNNKRFTNKDNQYYAKSFELDIYIPELNKAIEFDGRYWHSLEGLKKSHPTWPIEKLENYHELKDSFFSSKGIQILHVKEENWRKSKDAEIDKALEFLRGVA